MNAIAPVRPSVLCRNVSAHTVQLGIVHRQHLSRLGVDERGTAAVTSRDSAVRAVAVNQDLLKHARIHHQSDCPIHGCFGGAPPPREESSWHELLNFESPADVKRGIERFAHVPARTSRRHHEDGGEKEHTAVQGLETS